MDSVRYPFLHQGGLLKSFNNELKHIYMDARCRESLLLKQTRSGREGFFKKNEGYHGSLRKKKIQQHGLLTARRGQEANGHLM